MSGDTAGLLQQAGGATIVDLADEDAIYEALPQFLQKVRTGTHPRSCPEQVSLFSRRSQAQQLADALLADKVAHSTK